MKAALMFNVSRASHPGFIMMFPKQWTTGLLAMESVISIQCLKRRLKPLF